MNSTQLPGGLVDNNSVEMFAHNNKAMALYNKRTISFWDLPANIRNFYLHEMRDKPNLQRMLKIDSIKDENERLEQYIIKVYGKFDNTSDYINGQSNNELEGSEALASNGITRRETEILKLFGEGYQEKEIAEQLYISPATVSTHRQNILTKLHLHSLNQLTRWALKHNIITL